jgi:hypothetical protein
MFESEIAKCDLNDASIIDLSGSEVVLTSITRKIILFCESKLKQKHQLVEAI